MDLMFHVMRKSERLAILRMRPDGARAVFLPGRKTLAQAWPNYDPDLAALVNLWLDQRASKAVQGIAPGGDEYPRALAGALTHDRTFNLWAYVTPPAIFVSFNQVAHALGKNPIPALRAELEKRGLRFKDGNAPLPNATRILGEAADGLLLYPSQAADHLGISSKSASAVARRLGIAIRGRADVAITWGNLKRVRRVGPRKFELESG